VAFLIYRSNTSESVKNGRVKVRERDFGSKHTKILFPREKTNLAESFKRKDKQ
jgi:hypothetical protein